MARENLVRRQVRDSNGRWVTRWVRPDTPEVRHSRIPQPSAGGVSRPEFGPSPRVQRAMDAVQAIYSRPVERGSQANWNITALADHGREVLDAILHQCARDDLLRKVWANELHEQFVKPGSTRSEKTEAIRDFSPRLQAFPMILDLLVAAGQEGPYWRTTANGCSYLYQWGSTVHEFDSSNPERMEALYLLGIGLGVHESPQFEPQEPEKDEAEALWEQAGHLADRAEKLIAIVPHLLERGTVSPDVVDSLLASDTSALRAGEL